MLALLFQGAADPLANEIVRWAIGALVGEAVLSAIGAVGFIAISRRFMDREVPAELTRLNTGMDRLGTKVDDLARTLITMQQQQTLQEYRIKRLEEEEQRERERERDRDPLDETRGGPRLPTRPRSR